MARKRYRFDFIIPSASVLERFAAAVRAAGANHSSQDLYEGTVTRHTFAVDASDKELLRLIGDLYVKIRGSKVVPPWPTTGLF